MKKLPILCSQKYKFEKKNVYKLCHIVFLIMVCWCCIMNYRSNYTGEERTTAFSFPKEKDLKIRFVNRKD